MKHWFLAGLALGTAATIWANTEHNLSYTPGTYGSKMFGLSQGQKVSGSNVEVRIGFIHAPGSGTSWSHMKVRDVQIKLGNEVVFSEPGTYDTFSPSSDPKKVGIRFTTRASAGRWQHGAPIPISVRARVDLGSIQQGAEEGEPEWVPFGSATNLLYEHTYSVTSHNVLQVLGTDLNSSSQYDSVIEGASGAILNAAASAFENPYTVVPTSATSAMNESASTLLPRVVQATVFVANVHGSPTSFMPDETSTVYFYAPPPTPPEDDSDGINVRVDAKDVLGIPRHWLVAMWSCHTLSSANHAPAAFRLIGPHPGFAVLPGKAYLGFASSVNVGLWPKSTWDLLARGESPDLNQFIPGGLKLHAETLLSELSSGQVVLDALGASNALFPPVRIINNTIVLELMTLRGDGWTRSKGVYLTAEEAALLGGTPSTVMRDWVVLPVAAIGGDA